MATYPASLLHSRTQCHVDRVRLLAESSTHSGDWMHAPSIASIGLGLYQMRPFGYQRLKDLAARNASHSPEPVKSQSMHGHFMDSAAVKALRGGNDILWRAVKRAHIPAIKQPANLILQNWKRPDGKTVIPGPGNSQTPGMSLSETPLQNHTSATLPQRQVLRRTRQRPTKSPNMMNWSARTSFTQFSYKSEVSGITGMLSLFRKLTDGPHCSLYNLQNPSLYFSSRQ